MLYGSVFNPNALSLFISFVSLSIFSECSQCSRDVQNLHVSLQVQKRWVSVSVSFIQNVQRSVSLMPSFCKNEFVAILLCSNLNWNYLSTQKVLSKSSPILNLLYCNLSPILTELFLVLFLNFSQMIKVLG